MALKECEVYEGELEYEDILRLSKYLLNKLDHNKHKDGDGDNYMEMLKDDNKLERKERNRAQDEKDSVFLAYFMKQFPAQREKIERSIQCLREIADDIDKTHKKCTIGSIAANSTSASSSLLNILGLTLAPFTASGSLILTTTGIGFGAVAAVTGMSTTLYENVNNAKEKQRVQELIKECKKCLRNIMPTSRTDFSSEYPVNSEAVVKNIKQHIPNVAMYWELVQAAEGIKTNVKALNIVRNNPGLKHLAKQATAVGSTSQCTIKGDKNVEKAFEGTVLAMTNTERWLSIARAGASLLNDMHHITQNTKHLREGAKARTAAEIREEANKLEEQLHNLNKLYEELKDMMESARGKTHSRKSYTTCLLAGLLLLLAAGISTWRIAAF